MKNLFAFLLLIFITQIAMADDIVCVSAETVHWAEYEPYTYNCSSGYYLPANTLGCKPCPSGFNCPGGTFQFNPNRFQGLSFTENITTTMNNVCAANFPTDIFAIYEPNKHDCSTGFYMPANTDGCIECPENNYCVGGTYSFNETETQGIQECPDGMFSPVGSWECYERLLHVDDGIMYLKSHKLTEPSLHVKYEDRVYYANMTTVPTVMTRDSARFLKIMYNSTEYYVCDDTTYKN